MTPPMTFAQVLALVDHEDSARDLTRYFLADSVGGRLTPYTGRYFDSLAGGGDRAATADVITADDLIAVQGLSVVIPRPVAFDLLVGPLGQTINGYLRDIPSNVTLGTPEAGPYLAEGSAAWNAWDLLDEQDEVGWVTAGKLLARKRPKLIPVFDSVVRCVLRPPRGHSWSWFQDVFSDEDQRLPRVMADTALSVGLPEAVTPARTFDVIVWMRHNEQHVRSGCPGLQP